MRCKCYHIRVSACAVPQSPSGVISYLGDLAKLSNDRAITVNDLLLKIKPKLTPRLWIILHPSLIQKSQSITKLSI